MSEAERKAALDLFPYFSKNPIVFDVGSNKGEWADIFVHNVDQMHLFEPNELLLNYTMVKYCDKSHVRYCADAASNFHDDLLQFYFFINENNGLSSLLNNPRWDSLPKRRKIIRTTRLDVYANKMGIESVDLLKIDVEGWEYNVIGGCSELLFSKRVKFIQVEKAEHIHLSGHTFDELTAYLKSFGYIPMETSDTENVIFMQEGFTQDWNKEFVKNTEFLKGKVNFALEIGAFEGLTTRYICDNLLKKDGRVIAIDPLTDEYIPNHPDNHLFVGQYERFIRNTRNYPIELIRDTSRAAFRKPGFMDYGFDLIYIDGDHRENEVYHDAVNAFNVCLKNTGHIVFDDYEWREETKRGIDRFLNEYGKRIEIIHKGYQVVVRKLKNINE